MLNILDYFYPIRSITITNRDPHFVNPAIKALLRKRNRLRKGAVAAANSLTRRIGSDVTQATLIAKVMYAAPAWWGFFSDAEKDRIESVVKKAKRYGYLSSNFEHVLSCLLYISLFSLCVFVLCVLPFLGEIKFL